LGLLVWVDPKCSLEPMALFCRQFRTLPQATYRERAPGGRATNTALKDLFEFIVTVQTGLYEHSAVVPLQILKVKPFSGVAVSVTAVPDRNCAEHLAPQSMPSGTDCTSPLPVLVISNEL